MPCPFQSMGSCTAATRQLAKRQLTWLRSMPDLVRFDCLRPDLAGAVALQAETHLRGKAPDRL